MSARTRTVLIICAIGWGIFSAHSAEPEASNPSSAGALLLPYKKNLKQALMDGMKSGPLAAMAVCRGQAPKLAAEASRPGVTVGRTSHRLRNPANAPAKWMEPLLAAYRDADAPQSARSVALPDGRTGYVEPIYTQPLCLTCHGSDLAEPVGAYLKTHYPKDQATGFAKGEFRGMFWLVFDPAQP